MATAKENAMGLYLTGIRDGQPEAAVAAHTGLRYRQHSTGVPDGQEGFVAFFQEFLARNPKREINILRALQDGDKVFVHVHQSLNDGAAEWVTADFFDSDGSGQIIEHWDVIDALKATNASGHTMIDGPTEIIDLDRTDANRSLVKDFMATCLIARQVDRVPDFISADQFTRHNTDATDGLAAFLADFAPESCPLSYQQCFHVVAEGNLVATLSRARWHEQDLCRVDLFRIDAGKLVEHWDLSEPVPPAEELVNSGKF